MAAAGASPKKPTPGDIQHFIQAIKENKPDLLKEALAAGVDVNTPIPFSKGDKIPDISESFRKSPLAWAGMQGHDALVRILLQQGASAQATDPVQQTLLHWVCQYNIPHAVAIATLLIETHHGANVNALDFKGENPLFWLAARENSNNKESVELARYLISKQSQTNIADPEPNRNTPLLLAISNGNAEMATLLLNEGKADPNLANQEGQTPLHAAVMVCESVIPLLLEKGAKMAKDGNGMTPVEYAEFVGSSAFENKAPNRRKKI